MSRASDKARRRRRRSFRLKLEHFATHALGLVILPGETTLSLKHRVNEALQCPRFGRHSEIVWMDRDLLPASGSALDRVAALFGVTRWEPTGPETVEPLRALSGQLADEDGDALPCEICHHDPLRSDSPAVVRWVDEDGEVWLFCEEHRDRATTLEGSQV